MKTFSISELAAEFDITARTIRFYEDQGLLSPERSGPSGQKRVYSQRDRTRLRLTLRGKRLGLTLAQLRELLNMYESEADTRQQLEAFLKAMGQHKDNLKQQLEDINLSLAEIEAQEKRVIELLSKVPDQ
ncbi:MAG: MerR family DNA-binding transcriptional regulator [Burkholderiaceae bacterium]